MAQEELQSAGVCMQVLAGILQAWYWFWGRNVRAHTPDLISWTPYRPHVLLQVRLMFWVEGLRIFVVHAVLVCRQPINAFYFNLAKWDKSLSLDRPMKQTLESPLCPDMEDLTKPTYRNSVLFSRPLTQSKRRHREDKMVPLLDKDRDPLLETSQPLMECFSQALGATLAKLCWGLAAAPFVLISSAKWFLLSMWI